MSTEIQRRRGTTVEHASFTGADGEVTVDTSKNIVVVHDGSTAGGFPLAASQHTHTADEILGGDGFVISVDAGGTGASTAASALINLGGASLLHTHESEDIIGFGDNIRYVDSQAQFASAYAGTAKTIVLAANSYTTPATFIQGINLIHLGDPDDVTLTGTMTLDTAAGGVTQTTFQGITIDGNITFRAPFNNTLKLNEVVQANGDIELVDAASGILSVTGGEINSYNVQNGTLRTLGTKLTDVNSVQTGGTVEHRDILAEVNSAGVVIQAGADPVAEITSILMPAGTDFVTSGAATHWRLNSPSTEYYVWYNVETAADPSASGTGIEVGANTVDPASVIALNTAAALGAVGGASVVFNTSSIVGGFTDGFVVIENTITGFVVSAFDVNASIIASVRTLGLDSSGVLDIEGIRINNPSGQGIRLEGDAVATINGFIVTGDILTNGLTYAATSILRLGTHNLSSVPAGLVDGGGTLVALDHPVADRAIDSGDQFVNQIITNSAIASSAVQRHNVEGRLKQHRHQVFIPIIGSAVGLTLPIAGSANALDEIVLLHSTEYSGFLRKVIIEPLSDALPGAGASSFSATLLRYPTRVFADGPMGDLSPTVIVDSINVGLGVTIIDVSTLGQAASVLVLGGSPLVGVSMSGANASTIAGMGLTLKASSFVGGSTMENIMVTYIIQVSREE